MTQKQLQTGVAVAAALGVASLFYVFANPFFFIEDSTFQSASLGSTQGQLVAQDQTVGTGPTAEVGDVIIVNYTGRFENGTVFDTSLGKQPFTFRLGSGDVIHGWDLGLRGMQVGGKRLLIIPPDLGYGSSDYGPIPANSTLIFEIELLKIELGASVQ